MDATTGHATIGHNGVVTLRVHGRLHYIGIGRTHALLLIHDLHVRVIAAATGELLSANSESTPRLPTQTTKNKQLNPQLVGSAVQMSRDITTVNPDGVSGDLLV
ncbi:MAG: hypothetical protein M3Y89_03280 [Actinomycetota bacterium]|nr:hypothetical protein [Actinomycetota bacterium]